ncbi:M16 family metallopeptidase [Reichenbachiella ulvae]|uniref:Insulinase family protein n=1 Tax=Reichenbachiella ulvae TaxID=2980104 RepID=A0ABT3CXA0_9BACT|nr:pitrilysin family protein [Reichenbachiella ulvae]MCV9388110.1 insulinase family protein [Reichenbachiella ulvae]
MLDRTIAPPAGEIIYAPLQEAQTKQLNNGIQLFTLDAGVQPVFKVEVKLASGIWYESKPTVSWFAAKMLMEGTKNRSAKEISEAFDSLGAFVEISPDFDDISISVFGVNRTFDQVISLLNEILTEATFPQESLDTLRSIRKDQIQVNNKKNDTLASKKIREALFGLDYPYGSAQTEEVLDEISRQDLLDFYEGWMFNNPQVYLSGNLESKMIQGLEKMLENWSMAERNEGSTLHPSSPESNIFIERADSLQSSIRLAMKIPGKGDQDYYDFLIANTFLGGYFGSRLMKNIREEKGYTYGISSYPVHLKHQSFGVISTDVKAEYTQCTLDEIQKEIELLRTEGPSAEEIETVSNYLAGAFLSSIDTPFQLMKRFQQVNDFGLDYSYYEQYFEALKSIDAKRIQKVVANYLDQNQLYSSIVGRF